MIFNQKLKHEAIILVISSFFQLNNFLSFFDEKKLIKGRKVFLLVFSDTVSEKLIFHFKEYIEKFSVVEVIDMRRKNNGLNQKFVNIKFIKVLYYYFFVFKKIFKIKKSFLISSFTTYTKLQFPTLFFIIIISPLKIFLLEDGMGEYVHSKKNMKKSLTIFLFIKVLIYKKQNICTLQLAKSRKDYFGLLGQPFFGEKNFFDNREFFKNFIKKSFSDKISFNPKCLLIATKSSPHNFEFNKNLYIKTLIEINKKYSYSPNQILFCPHPREELIYFDELVNDLSLYSNINKVSSHVVENFLSQDNLEIVIGAFSSTLYYAKTIFNINQVYYIDDYEDPSRSLVNRDDYINIYNPLNIKKFKLMTNYEIE